MREKTLRVLEYHKIIEKLDEKAQSSLGKKLVKELKPEKDLEEIEYLQRETEEAFNILLKKGNPPLFGINEVEPYVRRAEKGGMLTPSNLIQISDSLRVVRALKTYLRQIKEDKSIKVEIIEDLIENLEALKSLEDEINRCIISEEEISDNASSRLSSIRRNIISKNDSVKSRLNGIITSNKYEKYLQDSIITIRDGRYVVPIKQENKRFFPGLVHDQSASGATLFVEPMAVVELNNELKELEIKEQEEIEEILMRLSGIVAGDVESISYNQEILQRLDFIFAKGKLAMEMNATRPMLNDDGYINIRSGRHPLLKEDVVVPIDLYLGDEFNSLVVTGPNTGGKTVSLKTVGLLTLIAQSGLHIPADFNSEIAVFKNIYADIGDEQSIEQSLSTFSSHMTNIVDILENVDEESLVLFDELGAGTDPTEGAALAMSILDYLLKRNIRTIATTHYSQLKIYALTTDGVRNAAVEFDVETLSPTFKLLIGVPGKSNAFEISKRLGLQDFIIDEAKKLVSEENVEFEDVLTAIDRDRKTIEEDKYEAGQLRQEVDRLRDELEKERDRTKESREKILEKAKEEARDILRSAKRDADNILKDLKGVSSQIDKESRRKLHEGQAKLKGRLDEVEGSLSRDIFDVKAKKPLKSLKVGETVEVLSLGQKGTVLELPDEEGNLPVQVGIMKVNVNISTLKRAEEVEEKKSVSTKKIIRSKQDVKNSIDLRGYSLDEALMDLDKYIDDAYIGGVNQAEIIHGKGTGVLREGVRSYLKGHRSVKSYRTGGFSEGGDGVTIIELK